MPGSEKYKWARFGLYPKNSDKVKGWYSTKVTPFVLARLKEIKEGDIIVLIPKADCGKFYNYCVEKGLEYLVFTTPSTETMAAQNIEKAKEQMMFKRKEVKT